MEVAEIFYKAKDGKLFTDPLKCEEYEKTIGILRGSVAELVYSLETAAKPDEYISGIILVRKPDGGVNTYVLSTACIDDKLENYVNVEDLPKENRYVSATVDGLIRDLKKKNQDLPCQYLLIWSKNIDFSGYGILMNYNRDAWPKDNSK